MAKYRKFYPRFWNSTAVSAHSWTDTDGTVRRVPSSAQRMQFNKFGTHAAVRSFVFRRDSFTCQACGKQAVGVATYSGRLAAYCSDGMVLVVDHVISLANGGTNHPDNLQALCDHCNAKKGATVDKQGLCRG